MRLRSALFTSASLLAALSIHGIFLQLKITTLGDLIYTSEMVLSIKSTHVTVF